MRFIDTNIDAYNAVLMKKEKIDVLYTYDEDFKSIPWITSQGPA